MNQPELFSSLITCPRCGFAGDVDLFDCAGMPDGVLICNQPLPPSKSKKLKEWNKGRRCSCFINTDTMTEWDGTDDDDE